MSDFLGMRPLKQEYLKKAVLKTYLSLYNKITTTRIEVNFIKHLFAFLLDKPILIIDKSPIQNVISNRINYLSKTLCDVNYYVYVKISVMLFIY